MLRSLAVVLLLSISQPGFASPKSQQTLAIVDVAVVPMDTERILEHQTVIIQGAKITSIRPYVTGDIPERSKRIDGNGRFLMPGLIDAHVHLMSPDDLISYLAFGVTTVVNMSGTPSDLKLRED